MIIIADSGSTKTDWRLLAATGQAGVKQTIGLNPHLVSAATFSKALTAAKITDWQKQPVTRVFFYSAGVTDTQMQEKLTSWLTSSFPGTAITVASDLLGAARAAYGSDEGIIGILGTGANSGYYNGTKITQTILALGYLLGDEGSGNALGKRLATAYLRQQLPTSLATEFKAFYPAHQQLLSNLYSAKQPARLLASLVPFLYQHQQNDFIAGLIREEFTRYFQLLQGYNKESKLALVGSVAHYFSNIISEIAANNGLEIAQIIKSPIDGLVKFHQQATQHL